MINTITYLLIIIYNVYYKYSIYKLYNEMSIVNLWYQIKSKYFHIKS